MALPVITSRNQVQKIPETEINGRVVLQPNTWYTCPVGKKARVKGTVVCTGRGAAATATFAAAGVVMFTWNRVTAPVAGIDYLNSPNNLTTLNGGQVAIFEVDLAAGDTIITDQNTGTNAEFNVFATVQETPA